MRPYRAGAPPTWLRIPALNLYLQFGFEPLLRDEGEQTAWRVIAPHLKPA